MYAQMMVALVLSAGHRMVEAPESTPERVVWNGRRTDTGDEFTSVWTIERAKQAGFTSNKLYESMPTEMLRAKAKAEVARTLFPDVLAGVAYAREELELEPQQARREPLGQRGVAGLSAALGITGPAVDAGPVEVPASTAQRKEVAELLKAEGLAPSAALGWLGEQLNREITSTAELTAVEADGVIGFLREEQAKDAEAAQVGEQS